MRRHAYALCALFAGAAFTAAVFLSACDPPFSTATPKEDSLPLGIGDLIGRNPADTGRRDSLAKAKDPVRIPVDTSGPTGLDSGRVSGGGVSAVPIFDPDQVPLDHPVWFGALPGKPGVYLALEQYTGVVAVIRKDAAGKWTRGDFLTLQVRGEGEMGLLGIAFHPRFAENRKYYVDYIPKAGALATVIDEREADASLLKDAGKPPRRILRMEQPYQNHKSGTLAFGPKDGFLYAPTGDGGATVAGQDRNSLLGKVLRLDVNAADSFRVPADNPFVGAERTRSEIWALGLRNPWKWSFDAETGALWAGDVGETEREEIDRVARGGNLGWGAAEGNYCRAPGECGTDLQPPVADFGRDELTVIIGGYVYRGDKASPWYGWYFFADFASREVFALHQGEEAKAPEVRELFTLPAAPSSFGSDAAGNLYLVGYGNGAIYRLEGDPAPGAARRGRL